MTERKFTPPTEFPAEYVTGRGKKVTLLARGKGLYPLIGQGDGPAGCEVYTYTEDGYFIDGQTLDQDLHDLPQKQVHWSNDYRDFIGGWRECRELAESSAGPNRIAVIRREWVEGELPQYFAEEV
jgi:hypothetical protein